MLINWLPMLLVGQGFRASQAAGVMFSLQIGAACGTLLLGALMDKLTPLRMSLLIYSGILASLLALGSASSLNGMLLAGFVAGLFATGGQSVLYALAPLFYPAAIRATGGRHRRGGGPSWRNERPAAGRQDAGPRHRHHRGDGGLGARHCAGRRGGVLADASSAARRDCLRRIRRSGKKMPGRRLACPRHLAYGKTSFPDAYRPYGLHLRLLNAIPGIRHAFLDVHETAAFPYAELAPVKLVHGNEVHHYQQPLPTRPHADAVFTAVAGQKVGVVTADCLPMLIASRDGRFVCSVHAGWQGAGQRHCR